MPQLSMLISLHKASRAGQIEISSGQSARVVAVPWNQGPTFELALRDFQQLGQLISPSQPDRARLLASARNIGAALFQMLSSDRLLQAITEAAASGQRACIAIDSEDDVVLALPWELLYYDSRFLVHDGSVDIVRTSAATKETANTVRPSSRFSIVINVSAPEDGGLSYEAEMYRVTRALADSCTPVATELGTLEDLVHTVARVRPTGVHFSGHGLPGALVFENDEGQAVVEDIDKIVRSIRGDENLRLPPFWFLASCHGNTTTEPSKGQGGSWSSAAQLHRRGVDHVVGYFGPIVDELSTRAEEALYAAIAAGETTRSAVAKARAALQRLFVEDEVPDEPTAPQHTAPNDAAFERHAVPFAWAQLVYYHRGPEVPLSVPSSTNIDAFREPMLVRTYRNIGEGSFLATGLIGRRRELHELRRRLKRGDRIFVLQGLGGLGKTTLAGHLAFLIATEQKIACIWCRRSDGFSDQVPILTSQLMQYARDYFGLSGRLNHSVDQSLGGDPVDRFLAILKDVAITNAGPIVLYLDNLDSLLQGPAQPLYDGENEQGGFASWRSSELRLLWQGLMTLATSTEGLYVIASCRYRNDDFDNVVLSVSSLSSGDVLRLMAWFPALRRLSFPTLGKLAAGVSGHPRAVELLNGLVDATLSRWEEVHGEWRAPSSKDRQGVQREWEQVVGNALPVVRERVWTDLLLARIWDGVLDEKARRMLSRATLLRRSWDDGVSLELGDSDDDVDAILTTMNSLVATSLLERRPSRLDKLDSNPQANEFSIHPTTSNFVISRIKPERSFALEAHRRLGSYFERRAEESSDFGALLDGGHHLFLAEEYDRASDLLGRAAHRLLQSGHLQEARHVLQPFMTTRVQNRMSQSAIASVVNGVGLALHSSGEARQAIAYFAFALKCARRLQDRQGEAATLGNLGMCFCNLGRLRRSIVLHERSRSLAKEIGDRHGECRALGNLGFVWQEHGEVPRAVSLVLEKLALSRQLGYQQEIAKALAQLGWMDFLQGNLDSALHLLTEALDISRRLGDPKIEGEVLNDLGIVYERRGQFKEALECYDGNLAITQRIGDGTGEGNTLGNLGRLYTRLRQPRRAIEILKRRIALSIDRGDLRGHALSLGNLGDAHTQLGEHQHALGLYKEQVRILQKTGYRKHEGNAHLMLGSKHLAMGQLSDATRCFEAALTVGREISNTEIITSAQTQLKNCLGGSATEGRLDDLKPDE